MPGALRGRDRRAAAGHDRDEANGWVVALPTGLGEGATRSSCGRPTRRRDRRRLGTLTRSPRAAAGLPVFGWGRGSWRATAAVEGCGGGRARPSRGAALRSLIVTKPLIRHTPRASVGGMTDLTPRQIALCVAGCGARAACSGWRGWARGSGEPAGPRGAAGGDRGVDGAAGGGAARGRARRGRGAAPGRLPDAGGRAGRGRGPRARAARPAGRPRRGQPRRGGRGRAAGPRARAGARRRRRRRRGRRAPSRRDGQPLNLNTATLEQLDTLAGIGPATAQTILDFREERGGFGSVEELGKIPGIGEARLATLREEVTV